MHSYIAVLGSGVRDVLVDVNLPDVYRGKEALRKVIRFHENDPIIRRGSRIKTSFAGKDFTFDMRLTPGLEREDRDVVRQIDGLDYYRLSGGRKYDFAAPSDLPPSSEAPTEIELPCIGRDWGGGGINLAIAIRGMSREHRTPITYLDTAPPLESADWYHQFWRAADVALNKLLLDSEAQEVDVNAVSDLLGRVQKAIAEGGQRSANVFLQTIFTLAKDTLSQWVEVAGERAFRMLVDVVSSFDALENVELYLTAR